MKVARHHGPVLLNNTSSYDECALYPTDARIRHDS